MVINNDCTEKTDLTLMGRLSMIMMIGCSLCSIRSFGELWSAVMAGSKQAFNAKSLWIFMHDPVRNMLEMTNYWGPLKDRFDRIKLRSDDGIIGGVFTSKEPVVSRLVLRSSSMDGDRADNPELLVGIFPLMIGELKTGVFGIVSDRTDAIDYPSPGLEFELSLFATYLSIAIENSKLQKEQAQQRVQIESYTDKLILLNKITQSIILLTDPNDMAKILTDGAKTLLECEYATVWLNTMTRDSGQALAESRVLRNFEGQGSFCFKYLMGMTLYGSSGNNIGWIAIANKKSGKSFCETDEKLLSMLCINVAVVIEKARAYEKEHNIAEVLQQEILRLPERISGLEIGIIYEAAAEAAKVGGDLYDIFSLEDGRVGILIGDVSGKGLKAAAITSMVKSTIRAFAYKGLSPAEVLSEANDAIYRQLSLNQFITMTFCILNLQDSMLNACRAGHPSMIIRSTGRCKLCEMKSNLPIGIFPRIEYLEDAIKLTDQDMLIFYTDGLTEARRGGRLLGEEKLLEEINAMVSVGDPQIIADKLVGIAKEYADTGPQDDIAIVVVRINKDNMI